MNWKKIILWFGVVCALAIAFFTIVALYAVHTISKEKNRKKTQAARAARHEPKPEPEPEEEEEEEEEEPEKEVKITQALDTAFEEMREESNKLTE